MWDDSIINSSLAPTRPIVSLKGSSNSPASYFLPLISCLLIDFLPFPALCKLSPPEEPKPSRCDWLGAEWIVPPRSLSTSKRLRPPLDC